MSLKEVKHGDSKSYMVGRQDRRSGGWARAGLSVARMQV